MIIKNSRTYLDNWLENGNLTVLLLTGDTNGRKIHDFMMDRLTSWRRCALIADPSILTQAERAEWRIPDSGGERYVVLGGDSPKTVGSKNTNMKLLDENGNPVDINIELRFVKGDRFGGRS